MDPLFSPGADRRPARPTAWLMVLTLLALTVAAATPGDAQEQPAEPAVDVGTTTRVEDPTGDVDAEMPTPMVLNTDEQDIVELALLPDDATNMYWLIKMKGHPETESAVRRAVALTAIGCTLSWSYDQTDRYAFTASFSTGLAAGSDHRSDEDASGSMEFTIRSDGWTRSYGYSGGSMVWDAGHEGYLFTIPKSHAYEPFANRPPGAGDEVVAMSASCMSTLGPFAYGDSVDLTDIEHPLGHGDAPDEKLTLRYVSGIEMQARRDGGVADAETAETDGQAAEDHWVPWDTIYSGAPRQEVPTITVTAGMVRALHFQATNRDEVKRLVRIQVTHLALDGSNETSPPADWHVAHAEHLELRRGEARTFRVMFQVPNGTADGALGRLVVRIAPVGDDIAAATAKLRVLAGAPLDAENNMLYLHGRTRTATDPLEGAVRTALPWHDLTISHEAELAGWHRESLPLDIRSYLRAGYTSLPMSRDLALAPEEPLVVRLDVQSDLPGSFGYDLSFWTNVPTGPRGGSWEYAPTGEPVALRISLDEFDGTIPADTVFYIDLYLFTELEPAGAPEQSRVILANSDLSFPIIETRPDLFIDSPSVPTLHPKAGVDPVDYVNPGTARDYPLVLANEGSRTDDIRLTVDPSPPDGWFVGWVPGDRFRLDAGAATGLAVRVTAPEDAMEGERYEFNVTASSVTEPRAKETLRLGAIVTQLEVETTTYERDDEDLDPVVDEARSPAVAPLLVVGVLAMLLRRGRRSARY